MHLFAAADAVDLDCASVRALELTTVAAVALSPDSVVGFDEVLASDSAVITLEHISV